MGLNGRKAITIRKHGHLYKIFYYPHEESAALKALLELAGDPDLNLSLSEAVPFIEYLGYDAENLARDASASSAA